MQLTLHTDYALRVLVYLAQRQNTLVTISELAEFYKISRNHLVKVVHHLANDNFILTTRGKHGGMRLARAPELISIGEVVRRMEPNFDIVECFGAGNQRCVISSVCSLTEVLRQAGNEFLAVLDNYTLAEAITSNPQVEQVFAIDQLLNKRY